MLRNRHELGITTVDVAARGSEFGTQVFVTLTRRRVNPTDTDAIAQLKSTGCRPQLGNHAHDLVPEDNGQAWRSCPSLDFIQLGMADAASKHPQQQLAMTRLWLWQLDQLQRIGIVCKCDNSR